MTEELKDIARETEEQLAEKAAELDLEKSEEELEEEWQKQQAELDLMEQNISDKLEERNSMKKAYKRINVRI